MRRFLLLTAALTATASLLAACGDDGGGESSTTDATDATDVPIDDNTGTGDDTGGQGEEGSATVALNDEGLLANPDGLTLYVFDEDDGTTSNCNAACLDIWPALTAEAEPVAGEGVDGALLSTAEQADGRVQVTYNGYLLYTYANDTESGQTNGDGVGGVWHVIDASGNPVS